MTNFVGELIAYVNCAAKRRAVLNLYGATQAHNINAQSGRTRDRRFSCFPSLNCTNPNFQHFGKFLLRQVKSLTVTPKIIRIHCVFPRLRNVQHCAILAYR